MTLSPVAMIEDGIVSNHAHEDVEEGGVHVRNNPHLIRTQVLQVPEGQDCRRNGQGLVEQDEEYDLQMDHSWILVVISLENFTLVILSQNCGLFS